MFILVGLIPSILNAQLITTIPITHKVTSIAVGSNAIAVGTDNGCIYIVKQTSVFKSFCPMRRVNDVASYGNVFVAVGSGQLVVFNENGVIRRFTIGGLYDSAVATNGEIAVACKWRCLAITLDGKRLWTFRVKWVRNGIAFFDNSIIIADALGRMIDMVDPKGKLIRFVNVDEEPWDVSVCKDRIYASLTTALMAFDKNLREVWSLGGFVSLLRVASNEQCYVAVIDSSTKNVVVVDPYGKVVSKIPVDATAIAWNGNYLYVGTSGGVRVYAFKFAYKPKVVKKEMQGIYEKLKSLPVVGDTLSKLFLKKALDYDYFTLKALVDNCKRSIIDLDTIIKELKVKIDSGELYDAAKAIGKAKFEVSSIKSQLDVIKSKVKSLPSGDEIIKVCGGKNVLEALENCSKSLEKMLKLKETMGSWEKVAEGILAQEERVLISEAESCIKELDLRFEKITKYQEILLALLG